MMASDLNQACMLEKEINIYKKLSKPHPNVMNIKDYYHWIKEEGL